MRAPIYAGRQALQYQQQSANDTHLQPSTINRIRTRDIARVIHPINENLKLPIRANSGASMTFHQQIRLAYERNYGKDKHYPSVFGNRFLQWARKLAFVDRYVPPL